MIKITIDKAASKQLLKLMKKGGKAFDRPIKIAIKRIGFKVQKRAKGFAPRKTGNLRRSIVGRQEGFTYIIGSNLIYAATHEFGDTKTPKRGPLLAWKDNGNSIFAKRVTIPKYKGRGYFAPALKSVSKEAQSILTNEILKSLK